MALVHDYTPGQRWINDAELQLGLGTILASDNRTITIVFLATGETRTYAKSSAPLTRVVFSVGDRIKSHDGWILTVNSVIENEGLLTYMGVREDGSRAELPEGLLDNFIQLNRPTERLFSGQIDQSKWFDLRFQSVEHALHLAKSDLRGLSGARNSLIPHQLYIAHEVAGRYAPRVLLADEVGLGKTIEAGLILHQQLLTERANRVLIVVPETLIHQWLVEMLRRFNLHFSVYDEERCVAAEDQNESGDNPFIAEQLVICSIEFFANSPHRHQQAVEAQWDLFIVDEAHHLKWSPEEISVEYKTVEDLARNTKGLILLTATPEQLGKESHFARLRLLDPDRFHDYERFIEEEKHYEPVANAVEELLSGRTLSEVAYVTLKDTITENDSRELLEQLKLGELDQARQEQVRQSLVEQLLDRHGTGRVLYRNTRAAVKGFPGRLVHAYPLPLPAVYASRQKAAQASKLSHHQELLCPELLIQGEESDHRSHWTAVDSRPHWLMEKLRELRPHKVLVITATAGTAMDLADYLRIKAGIHAAVFHEHLSIVERDRAAAYFADQEYGSQVLICSEIGSEGRNFQFAHHLILFDLPLNPDLLEQRIGRLDRIGQTETIKIHIPYLENSPQAVMYRWYNEGISALEKTCPAGHSTYTQVESMLIAALHQSEVEAGEVNDLITTSRLIHERLNQTLQQGRDRLLEYNSCRIDKANAIADNIRKEEKPGILFGYLEHLFDCYGIDIEEHSEKIYIIRPGEKMQSSFPGLQEDGMTITCDRETALANEHIHFISWEHPMIMNAMDMVLSSELGNSTLTSIRHRSYRPGSLFIECIYLMEVSSTMELQANRYLPTSAIRIVVDQNGHDHSTVITTDYLAESGIRVDSSTANKVVKAYKATLQDMVEQAESRARQQAPVIIEAAHVQSKEALENEINRLKALRQVNPNVREEEITYYEQVWHAIDKAVDKANIRLDAIRVIVSV